MGETRDAYVVEIPVDEEHQEKRQMGSNRGILEMIQQHPLSEISESPGHLLLLKLCLLKESRIDSIKREIFQLCCFFLVFHGFFFTILYSSSEGENHGKNDEICRKWWIPSAVSLASSLVMVLLVQAKLFLYWKVCRRLERERNDNRALTRCVQELRMKGSSFDLSKEPLSGKRMKSSSVEIKWKPVTWFSQYLITIVLLCIAGLFFPISKFILCGF
ncbi:PREDICTED: uncharacterized protein LOC104811695 [Tarenaya hassleriana]|uniref:uncharacterized protein LOC104811695 n=1 Tax=Tarenaya hassleriana TaxID=28532 RepID=UPI00053C6FA8|nr:PREDICTED: uncharacterized protein LOC104811695 [Tarenaya hassleriana]XP_010536780.1 PREDICTED: uncharacterized protein LOC104811695 [Tarenaya hassleriana]